MYECESKLKILIEKLLNSAGYKKHYGQDLYFRETQEDITKKRKRLAASIHQLQSPDFYTLNRLIAIGFRYALRNGDTAATLREITKYIDVQPQLDALFCDFSILQALESGQLSFEFMFSLNQTEIDYALQRSAAGVDDLADLMIQKRISILTDAGIQPDELWQLCIDQKDLKEGPYVYDFGGIKAEPGYLCAAQSAFMFILDNLSTPLTPEFIKKLWQKATCQVRLMEGAVNHGMPRVSFGRLPAYGGKAEDSEPDKRQKITTEDLEEVLSYGFSDLFGYREEDGQLKVVYLSKTDSAAEFLDKVGSPCEGCKHPEHQATPDQTLSAIISEYYERLGDATTDDEKLYAIARFVKMIDVMHPFHDGNMRTCVLLINKLLIENQLTPTIMPNPNNIDIKNSGWIVEHLIKPGQQFFLDNVGLNPDPKPEPSI